MKETEIGIIIPCYKCGKRAIKVVEESLKRSNLVVVIDDNCPLKTGAIINSAFNDKKLKIIYNQKNLGVGGATKIGINWLIKKNCQIIVKIDGDGQMDPVYINDLIKPIIDKKAEFVKGNRFNSIETVLAMPKIRLFGNLGLSFLTKLSTGYWELFDPTNGYIAFSSSIIKKINLYKVDNRYFFETDLLFRCAIYNISIKEVMVTIIYQNEISSLDIKYEFFNYSFRHLLLFFKRIIYQYFILDFNPGSLEIILFIFTSLISFILGITYLIRGFITNEFTSAGNVSLFLISTIISIQLLSAFIFYDTNQKPLMRKFYNDKNL